MIFCFIFRSWFNIIHESGGIGEEQADQKTTIQFDDLKNRIKESELNFRRSMVIFCNICIIAEYRALELLEIRDNEQLFAEHRTYLCKSKLRCFSILMSATTETAITIKDIEHFLAILNPLIGEDIAKALAETSRKIFWEVDMYYQPRSLKDLCRCEIRASISSFTTMPKQVNQLPIPAALKKFVLFDNEEIWGSLKGYQQFIYLLHQIKRMVY